MATIQKTPEEAVKAALDMLLSRDRYLLEVDANERSIAHRLAVYLEPHFLNWHVDCEYNRQSHQPKVLRSSGNDQLTPETDGSRVFPDIIVHKRGSANNLLVIEIKKSTSSISDQHDLAKLNAYKRDLFYQHALFLRLHTGSSHTRVPELCWL